MCAATPALSQSSKSWWAKLDRDILKRITLTGYRSLSYHDHRVTGDREAFNTTNYSGQGDRKFTDFGQVNVVGRNVLGILNFEGTVLDSRLTDPQSQRFSVNYRKGGWGIDAGDIQATMLNTNRFASINKSIRGASVGYRSGKVALKGVYSEVKGSPRTIALQGNNSSGPYYLQSTYLVLGSESIRVDDEPQLAGTDYTINYESGAIVFVNKSIPLTSTIVATFEAFGFNERRGTLQAVGASYDMGRGGKFGVTSMRQMSPNRGTSSTRLEKFEGFGAASTPYFLQFEPLAGSVVTIRVNGVLQREFIDYRFDTSNPAVFYFTRFMPRTDQIDVVYTPKPRGTVDGDRDVIGLDYTLPLGKRGDQGSFSVSQAIGRLSNTVTPQKGTARGAALTYSTGIYRIDASATDIPRDFVGIETTSFNRNERSYRTSLDADPKGPWTWRLSQSNSSISTRTTNTQGNLAYAGSRFVTSEASARYDVSDLESWRISQTRQKTTGLNSTTRIDSSEIAGVHSFGPLRTNLSLLRQGGYTRGSDGVANSFNILGVKLGSTYFRGPLSVTGNMSLLDISAAGQKGVGRDYDLNIGWSPSNKLRVSTTYAMSDSGSLVTLQKYSSGYGNGYDGNAYTGGLDGAGFASITNLRRWFTTVQYSPTSRLSMTADYRTQRSSGSVSSNSNTSGYGINMAYELGGGNRANLSYDRSLTTFIDSPQTSGIIAYSAYLQGQPPGRLTYSLGWNQFSAIGNSTTKQDNGSLFAELGYFLGGRHRINLNLNDARTSGYLPQSNSDFGVTYTYQIWRNLGLNASYRWRKVSNRDASFTSGAYRASGFDVELSFDFGRW
jgi:hypothetical protein